jgi:LysM repeat protein
MQRKLILSLVLAVLVIAMSGLALLPAQAQTTGYCTQHVVVQRGETLYRIALRHNTTVANLKAINFLPDANRIFVGQSLCVAWSGTLPSPVTPAPPATTYTVQRGDNLFRIAQRFSVPLQSLARTNNIINYNRIYAGQVLVIPRGQPVGQPTPAQPGPVPGSLTVGTPTIAPEATIHFINQVYWVSHPEGLFTISVPASGAVRVEFYLRATNGAVTRLGQDRNPFDGWSFIGGLPPHFRGTVYAVAYNAAGQSAQSAALNVARG